MFRGRRAASRRPSRVKPPAAGGYDDAATQGVRGGCPPLRDPVGHRRIDDANRQFKAIREAIEANRRAIEANRRAIEANREAIEAHGRRIDERFDALQALILEALEARRAQAD